MSYFSVCTRYILLLHLFIIIQDILYLDSVRSENVNLGMFETSYRFHTLYDFNWVYFKIQANL